MVQGIYRPDPNRSSLQVFTGFPQLSHSRVLGISSSQAWRPDSGLPRRAGSGRFRFLDRLSDLRLHGGLGAPWSKGFTGRTQNRSCLQVFHSRILGLLILCVVVYYV